MAINCTRGLDVLSPLTHASMWSINMYYYLLMARPLYSLAMLGNTM